MELLYILIPLLLGWINSYFAQTRGRSPLLWFILGFFFGIISLIVLFLLPSCSEEAPPQEPPPEKDEIHVSRHSPFDQQDWYYLDDDRKQHGPHTFMELRRFLHKELIAEETYVWNETMSEWKKIKAMPELLEALRT